jgi:uncharacterized phiE125 gp8 family phage protein
MGVIITRTTESHLDYFTRNLTVGKDSLVATAHGYVSAARLVDATHEPLTIAEAKTYLRFAESEHDQDGEVQEWIKGARQKLEKDTGLALTTQSWRATVEQFPSYRQSLYLPVWPVQSIEEFVYVDRDGTEQNLLDSPSNYLLGSTTRPAQLGLITTATWPTDGRQFQPGTLDFTAGWTQDTDIPAELLMAMKKLIGDFAGFRESALIGQVAGAPQSYDALIAAWVLPGGV